MNTHFTHLSSDVFPEATKFDPYRWLNAEKEGTRAELERYFNPFGRGSRNCIGLKCVSSSISLVTFDFPSPDQSDCQNAFPDALLSGVVLQTQRCT